MSFEGEQLQVTELDFATIKQNLIDYIKNSDSEFTDWDFEGSNLNQIFDVLAYNTHYNAMLAHMAVNESFIDSAQLRSSIISIAKKLGYTPKSFSAAKAELDGRFRINPDFDNAPTTFTLKRGTRFTTTSTSGAYQFLVMDDYIPLIQDPTNTNYYITSPDNPIIVYQGRLISKDYIANGADDSHRYIIQDFNIDISTLRIRVYPTSAKTPGTSILFQRFGNEINIDESSAIYFLNENSFGQYEFQFGNGIYGRKLRAGEVIEVDYLVTEGSITNGINSRFVLNSAIPQIISTEFLTLRDRVSGGGEREPNNRLKQNAVNNFVIQNRAVTADDYKHLILSNFQYTESVSVWGGEDNDPPMYGQVFIAIKPKENSAIGKEGFYLSNTTKADILNFLKNKKVLSITPKIVDPNYVNIVLDVLFKYDTNLIPTNRADLEDSIRNNVIATWNRNQLNSFDTIFRHSQFQREVDNYDRSILNSLVRVFVKQSFTLPNPDVEAVKLETTTLKFGVPLVVDDNSAIIEVTSDIPWTENGEDIFIGDEATNDPNIQNIYTYTIQPGGGTIKKRDIGQLNLETGTMTINGSTLYTDNEITINILTLPKSNDLVGKRNLLLRIDLGSCIVRGTVDEITAGGSSRSVNYITFDRDRTK